MHIRLAGRTLFLWLLFQAGLIRAQNSYPTGYFRAPLEGKLSLAGNFGEIRPNHFHAGFDLRTGNKEGMPVFAVADGYVSRIKISPFGYGKAIYISHPNGYTSVYGHLQSFHDKISIFAKAAQYQLQSFELDTLLAPTLLLVRRGELIGLSGNTGGSQGPHLHFEIRENATEMPVNPFYFGYHIPDTVRPRIVRLAVYPLKEGSFVNGKNAVKKISPLYKSGRYTYRPEDTLLVHGEIGFGIECYDTENNSLNRNGVFSVELQKGGKRIYYHEFEKFSFDKARYVNAHIDYAEKQRNNITLQKCFLSENNLIDIYKDVLNRGRLHLANDSVHWLRFIVKDFAGNTTELMLKVRSRAVPPGDAEKFDLLMSDCSSPNMFQDEGLGIYIPANALYDDFFFLHKALPSRKGCFSPTYALMDENTALHKAFSLSIRADSLSPSLREKACIISFKKDGKRVYEGGNYKDGQVVTAVKTFGSFAVSADTAAPALKTAFKYKKGQVPALNHLRSIGIIARDDLSGIKRYKATIDGQWVLCEYETKQDLLFYTFDEKVTAGTHTFLIEVWDDKENKSSLEFKFKR